MMEKEAHRETGFRIRKMAGDGSNHPLKNNCLLPHQDCVSVLPFLIDGGSSRCLSALLRPRKRFVKSRLPRPVHIRAQPEEQDAPKQTFPAQTFSTVRSHVKEKRGGSSCNAQRGFCPAAARREDVPNCAASAGRGAHPRDTDAALTGSGWSKSRWAARGSSLLHKLSFYNEHWTRCVLLSPPSSPPAQPTPFCLRSRQVESSRHQTSFIVSSFSLCPMSALHAGGEDISSSQLIRFLLKTTMFWGHITRWRQTSAFIPTMNHKGPSRGGLLQHPWRHPLRLQSDKIWTCSFITCRWPACSCPQAAKHWLHNETKLLSKRSC